MRNPEGRDCCLIVDCLIVLALKFMKNFFILLATILAFSCCTPRLTEKVEVRFPNEQPQVVLKVNKKGECVYKTEFYQTGQVRMEGPMKNGRMEGEWTAYLPDGRVQSHGYFEDGKRTGAATVYWENGNLREEGFYKNGHHCGHWKWYDEQGNLIREEDYPE